MPFALKIFAVGVFVLGVLGALFVVPPKKKPLTLLQASKYVGSEVQSIRMAKDEKISQEPFAKQFMAKRGYLLLIHLLCTCTFGMLVASNYKVIVN